MFEVVISTYLGQADPKQLFDKHLYVVSYMYLLLKMVNCNIKLMHVHKPYTSQNTLKLLDDDS